MQKQKHTPAIAPAVTVATIAASFSEEISANLRMHLDQKAMLNHVNMREVDALTRRRSHTQLAWMYFDAAMTIWHLAQKSGIGDQLDIDPDLLNIIKKSIYARPAA